MEILDQYEQDRDDGTDEKVEELVEGKDHEHEWEIDEAGDGKSKTGDHEHDVLAFVALPCTEDSHIHRLGLPAVTEESEWNFNPAKEVT